MQTKRLFISYMLLLILSNKSFADMGWMLQSSGITGEDPSLNSVHFVDENIGWIVGNDINNKIGYVLHTIDGGKNWNTQNSAKGNWNYFESIFFTDPLDGWIVGGNGEMFYTADGGNIWSTQGNFDPGSYFWDVFFLNKNYGIAVGANYSDDIGIVIKTENGGDTWDTIIDNTLVGNYLKSVYIINENIAWAAGYEDIDGRDYGVILKTENRGDSWTIMKSGIQSSIHGTGGLQDIFFINETNGWAVGYSGIIVNTNDAGENWQIQNEEGNVFRAVHFIDQKTGWVVGAYGKILKTTDGGSNWTEEESNTGNCLESVFFTGQQNGWAVGSNWPKGGEATILHYGEMPSGIDDKDLTDFDYILDYKLFPSTPNPVSNQTTI
jgi:photosystem II stability/assembly factor-like uncharacterized protein